MVLTIRSSTPRIVASVTCLRKRSSTLRMKSLQKMETFGQQQAQVLPQQQHQPMREEPVR